MIRKYLKAGGRRPFSPSLVAADGKRAQSVRRWRLGFETLEDRRLMTATSSTDDLTQLMHPLYEAVTTVDANGAVTPLATSAPTGNSPASIRKAYGFDQISFSGGTIAGNGAGTTIAIVDAYDDPNIAADLHQFDVAFGLPDPTFTKVNQNGGSTMPAADSGWAGEIALDVEWAHAIAPLANILLVEATDNSLANLFKAIDYARKAAGVVAVSMSWGGGEFSGEKNYDSYFTTPSGHGGVAFFVSSGDSGAPAEYPSASPNVVSVGGTTLRTSGGVYSSETAWSGSGSGLSSIESQPSYQKGMVTQSTTARGTPDVAYDADPNTGFAVYDSYGTSAPWQQYGGTSDAAPQWAALTAIADQGRALAGLPSLTGAQLLADIYQMSSSNFHDVTSGSSRGTTTVSASTGYDLVTGRGSPIANLVVSALVGTTTSTPTQVATHLGVSAPSTATAGNTFSVTVSALDSSNAAVTGYLGTVHFSSSDVAAGLPADYTFTAGDRGVHTFTVLTLAAVGSDSVTVTDKANSSLTGSATVTVQAAPVVTSGLIEGFESGSLSAYHVVGATTSTASISTTAAHDGTRGLVDTNGGDWIYRNDSGDQVKAGDTVSVWLNFSGAADGRAYFGFGASASGTLSLVAAPNTNQLVLQRNTGYNFTDLAATSMSWAANHWYKLEVNWGTSGNIVAKVYDSDGTTLLKTLTGATTAITPGGVAFRGFGSAKLWDSVTLTPGVNSSAAKRATLAVSGPSSSSLSDNGFMVAETDTSRFSARVSGLAAPAVSADPSSLHAVISNADLLAAALSTRSSRSLRSGTLSRTSSLTDLLFDPAMLEAVAEGNLTAFWQ